MMSMEVLREKIDRIDRELLGLFQERMDVAGEIGAFKRAHGLPILDRKREREKLEEIGGLVASEKEPYARILYDLLFELSRSYQRSQDDTHSPLYGSIQAAVQNTPALFPPAATVACQGVEGAYSQLASQRLFKRPNVLYFKSFESVFAAIEAGLCEYGMLPLENSTAGSVTKIYDLMQERKFHIVRAVRLKVEHSLLVPHGTRREQIREIYSHEQAISQCAGFLEALGPQVKITRVENTAAAAKAVAESGRQDVAAISSHSCMELYGLDCLQRGIQDRDNNYTRFICISRKLEIYPGADRTSIMMVLPHRPGSLYKVLSWFYTLGINLNKLESRPLPGRDFEFMFYFDLETSIYSEEFLQLVDDLQELSEEFTYLGSYTEVI